MSTSASLNANIARHLPLMAASQPDRMALKVPRGRNAAGDIDYLALTFAELEAEVNAWSARLLGAGVRRGDRTLVMVRQGLPLIASAFALFQVGAVPVIVDPGMGLRSFLRCVERSQPRALVGIPLAQLVSRMARRAFRSVEIRVRASNALSGRLSRPGQPCASSELALADSSPSDLAAVLFTSGSTGAPKGVCYEHGMFDAQVRIIRATYGIAAGEVDLPMLPIFALFGPALGMTTVVPEIDPRRPARVDPNRIVQAILQENVTNSFGSPTLWGKIADHCLANGITLPGMRRVLCAGAPVPARLWESAPRWMPNGQLHSPYGATEALPVTSIASQEYLLLARCAARRVVGGAGEGACVGRAVAEASVKIIAISDSPIAHLAEARELPVGDVGEIIVAGPTVTKRYDAAPEATAAAKIADPLRGDDRPSTSTDRSVTTPAPGAAAKPAGQVASAVWHRMGDCGYLDADGRLWFCGRKVERVQTATETLFTEPCERVFRAHPRVGRCALVGLGVPGAQQPAMVVEARIDRTADGEAFARELRALAREHPHTASICRFFFHPRFPVDVRHNAKIHRLTLARWAQKARGFHVENSA